MGAVKKEQIEKAARRLFREKGYHDTSLRDISRQAGVSVSSISYYFGTKEDLYHILFPEEEKHQFDHLGRQPARHRGHQSDVVDQIVKHAFRLYKTSTTPGNSIFFPSLPLAFPRNL